MAKGLSNSSSFLISHYNLHILNNMGRKLDALMGKRSKSWEQLKPLTKLASSRLVVLKNQRQARCSLSRSDVVQLLTLGQHDRALVRVEQVIKEENMMDVYVMLEGYCFMIMERIHLIEQHEIGECPEEVNEAVSCLIYAASRCGEFPELQQIRAIFTHRYGKEFAARAIELRNNCSVNRQMIIKLSPRQPDLKSRLKMLKQIAAENKIELQLTFIDLDLDLDQVILDQKYNSNEAVIEETKPGRRRIPEEESTDSDSVTMKTGRQRQYKDVADAAQAAFESAAYAAAAARAAVELSKPQNPRGDVSEIQPSSKEEEIVETVTKSKEEDEGLQKNRSNLEEKEEGEDPVVSQSSSSENQTASNAKPDTNRFMAWTRRRRM